MYQNKYGWICPKCGKVHAPCVLTCDCDVWYTYPYGQLHWQTTGGYYEYREQTSDTTSA